MHRFGFFYAALLLACVSTVSAQALTAGEQAEIATAVQKTLADTGSPSISVGVARKGQVYTKAFGSAVLARSPDPGENDRPRLASTAVPADSGMAYPIGSNSKQFTAVCVLLLQEHGKLKLDDPVAKWFPEFTSADKVTLRNLLTHTSGYSDDAPQDYTIPAWTKPVKSMDVVREWATKPLDFEPGTKWQYSNTNFQLAALIVEKVSGQSFHDFLWQNVILPLKLKGVLDLDIDRERLRVRGYERHAMGPLRPAILEAPGWYTGDGSLAMPPATLMAWDESIVHRTLLQPASYKELTKPYILKDGTDTHYALGLGSRIVDGKRMLFHAGEVGGFVSANFVDVDDDVSIAALTNIEGPTAGAAVKGIRAALLPALAASSPAPESTHSTAHFGAAAAQQVRSILAGLQHGKLDRSLFTADTNYYFTPETLEDFRNSLAPLGALRSVEQTGEELRGGMVYRDFTVKFAAKTISANTYTEKDGKIEQFLVTP